MQSGPLPLVIENLSKWYGSLRALDEVSFTVQPGEVFGLLGPNGAGKTSLISIIVTLEQPNQGSAKVYGADVVLHPRSAKMNVGLVPQELINHGYFNVEEVLQFHSGYYGIANNKERIGYLLNRLGLWEHRHKKVKQLSGGMKRRMLIAKALVHGPRLLLLDEPTAGVDIELRNSLWNFVRELKQEGTSVLLTTHYLEEAEQLCDRVGILHKGKLLKLGPTQTLIRDLSHKLIRIEVKNDVAISKSPYLIKQDGKTFEFQVPARLSSGEFLEQLNFDLKAINDIQIKEGNLEEAFRSIVKEPVIS